MKILVSFLIGLVAIACFAAPDHETFSFTTVPTNATAQTTGTETGSLAQSGIFKGILIDLGGYASPTLTVEVVTDSSSGLGYERILYKNTAVTADLYKPVKNQSVLNSTGAAISDDSAYQCLYGEKLKAKVYAANVTNAITVTIECLLEK